MGPYEQIYGSATFEVEVEDGWTYFATLNGESVPVGEEVEIDDPNYYELFVTREEDESGTIIITDFKTAGSCQKKALVNINSKNSRRKTALPLCYYLSKQEERV